MNKKDGSIKGLFISDEIVRPYSSAELHQPIAGRNMVRPPEEFIPDSFTVIGNNFVKEKIMKKILLLGGCCFLVVVFSLFSIIFARGAYRSTLAEDMTPVIKEVWLPQQSSAEIRSSKVIEPGTFKSILTFEEFKEKAKEGRVIVRYQAHNMNCFIEYYRPTGDGDWYFYETLIDFPYQSGVNYTPTFQIATSETGRVGMFVFKATNSIADNIFNFVLFSFFAIVCICLTFVFSIEVWTIAKHAIKKVTA